MLRTIKILKIFLFIALCSGCSLGQTYLDQELVKQVSTADVTVFSPPRDIHLQTYGSGGAAAFGAATQLAVDLVTTSRAKKANSKIDSIRDLIDKESNQATLQKSFKENLSKISWLKLNKINFINQSGEFDLAKEIAQSKSDIFILASPVLSFAPSMNFVEVRTSIQFYQRGLNRGKLKPFYEIIAVTQSEQFNIPNLDERKFYKDASIKAAIDYLTSNDGIYLKEKISEILNESGRVVLAAINDASNNNLNDRVPQRLTLRNFPYVFSDDHQKGYTLNSFETEDFRICRPAPDPMNAPIGVPNAIYSVPKDASIISIWNRN